VTDATTAPPSARAGCDVRLSGVTKRFGDQVVIDDLNLSIEGGSFYALLGPSGCGKTTTLRMIGGFEYPTTGTVALGGEEVTDRSPDRRDVNTVFQSYALFPHMTIEKNVAYGLERKRVPKAEIRTRVGEALETVQLGHLAKRKPTQLSGGQQQRVALARALVNRPRALLLDEPLGALDLRLRRDLQIELKRIQREVGITFIHVTHDQEEAMSMADTIAVMNGGRIEQAGSANDLYEHPRTAFVANFLGTSNLIDATVERAAGDGGLAVVKTRDGRVLRLPTEALGGRSGAVRVGVRPEKVRIVAANGDGAAGGDEPAAAADNAVRGRIVEGSYLGVSTHWIVRTADGAQLTVVSQNVTAGDAHAGTLGQEVDVVWAPEHTFAVDAAAEQAERADG
jgi:spermidine/putrescine transport system ATP-binding protein